MYFLKNSSKSDSTHIQKIKIIIQHNTFRTTTQPILSKTTIANKLKRKKTN